MSSQFATLYNRFILGHPLVVLLVAAIVVAVLGFYATQFRLDASADTLVLESDQTLEYYRSIKARYGSDDSLIVTYTPKAALFSDEVLDDLKLMRDQFRAMPRIESVTTLLDVPLIESPPVSLSELSQEIITLESPRADRALAQREFLLSPLYRDMLLSPDGRTTALQLLFKRDEKWFRLLHERNGLQAKRLEATLTEQQSARLVAVSKEFDRYSASQQKQLMADIASVRAIMAKHSDKADLFLGGVPMIASDSIEFVGNDLAVFGFGVFAFLVVILTIIFGRPRWVFFSMVTCLVAGLMMMGLLGLLDWPVTVVSSNFVSLMLILTLSLIVHLIVRYRELLNENPTAGQRELLLETVRSKVVPSLYTSLTTMVAFASLLVSGIRPVIDFGWMMVIGITISLLIAFTIFPAALMLLKAEKPVVDHDFTEKITRLFASANEHYGRRIMIIFALLATLSVWGITQLTVENRFIDYYKKSTEIYRGMELIDRKLGGTTPLDVVIDAPASFFANATAERVAAANAEPSMIDDIMDIFSGEDEEAGITGSSYWFNSRTLNRIGEIHDYLDGLPETGKVLSITTTIRMLKSIDSDILTDNLSLSILYKRLPQEIKSALIAPYLSADGNQLRFSIRVFESDISLNRQELLAKIQYDLVNRLGLEPEQIHVSGMVVLYNNMLQSLFSSQIQTIGVVFVAIMLMFGILFRNMLIAVIAIIPNLIAAGSVLGIMGWLSIPLDMMTITIAAICIGIGVDDTIHYVHRFSEEFKKDGDYWGAERRSHNSIGRAMYYTSLTITLGFSILAFSNFIPTIYFGLLTGFSMVMALVANMTLLPLLIVRFKPLGPERVTA
jgi:predicted RND superfamily exporter protein